MKPLPAHVIASESEAILLFQLAGFFRLKAQNDEMLPLPWVRAGERADYMKVRRLEGRLISFITVLVELLKNSFIIQA